MKIAERLKEIRRVLNQKELDAVFISQPQNRYYLSGFNGSAGYLLITERAAILATDFRYVEQVKIQSPDYELFQISGSAAIWFPELTKSLNIKRMGFESGDISFNYYRILSEALGKTQSALQLVPTEGLVEGIRAVKDAEEIALISAAVDITDSAFAHIENIVRAGMTEKDIAWELEKFQREHGSQALPFDIIVASGPNAALPHHKPTDRVVANGEPIVIDMGARVGGYCSDFTRTICIGKQDEMFRKVYDTVLGAQLAAIALIKEGISGGEADGFARTVIAEAGYGDAFGHSLGHGVGLAEHENPRLSPNAADILSSGMVFSIEPGIYIPGWGGVRIEDLAVIENDSLRIMSKGRK